MSVVENQGWQRAGKQKNITEIHPKWWVITFVSVDDMKRTLLKIFNFPIQKSKCPFAM